MGRWTVILLIPLVLLINPVWVVLLILLGGMGWMNLGITFLQYYLTVVATLLAATLLKRRSA